MNTRRAFLTSAAALLVTAPAFAQKEKEPEAAPPAPVEQPKPQQQDADDCKTPYYFEGNKKIFKPNCL